ncbi:hypothetical protein EMEDMD4_790044 [Sinorhizobium medicae]|uniref:Uncharacterized protein n=1 Tax=Sinorhizobium medicae TaxID=110321 RepID=A0A508X641_9HYPH|nr:hypothetical protein EMEDMD4_790044 [Sinorhizobium medicae]
MSIYCANANARADGNLGGNGQKDKHAERVPRAAYTKD